MRAVLEEPRAGKISILEVPQPELKPGGILVRTAFSAISAGTERAHREQAEKSLLGKAWSRPDLVRQVVNVARAEGVRAAYDKVQSRLNTLSPLGYSCAGVVLAVGDEAKEFQPGDRVACGGVGYASHCEVNYVPRNLAARVPDGVSLEAASLTTIGSIALQGFRQSRAVLGETVAVIGAGLVGVLTVQLAKAAGCRVLAIDVNPARAKAAEQFGADLALCAVEDEIILRANQFAPAGADVAIITAAAPSAAPVQLAAKLVRDRARLVVVGAVGLGVSRDVMYFKELSLSLSRSYGPGRYDCKYEEEGVDYPIGYVRWTEKRNMESFLELLRSKAINVAPLLERRCTVDEAGRAYQELNGSGAYTVLIEYPQPSAAAPATQISDSIAQRTAAQVDAPERGRLRVGCIGAGAFARGVIFPALQRMQGVVLQSVATGSGVAAESARRSFKFVTSADPEGLLHEPGTDAVFVISRHSSHAKYVLAALAENKPVFVEKPLAVNGEQLDEIRRLYARQKESGFSPFLMVGFNRRFAPFSERLHEFFSSRREAMVVHARVNAGWISRDHWCQQDSEGGRIIGELCHFVDWARFVVGRPIVSVNASALPDGGRYNRDNVAASLRFSDGSVANLLYLANGDKAVAKEHFEVFCEGKVARIEDFCTLELTREGKTKRFKSRRDKGHNRELQLTVAAMQAGTPAPIAFEELVEVSEATLAILKSINTGLPVHLAEGRMVSDEMTAQEGHLVA